MTIEKKYWSVLSEGQQKEFKSMNDEARNNWWHKHAKDIKKKVPQDITADTSPLTNTNGNPSETPKKKVNLKKKTVTNGQF